MSVPSTRYLIRFSDLKGQTSTHADAGSIDPSCRDRLATAKLRDGSHDEDEVKSYLSFGCVPELVLRNLLLVPGGRADAEGGRRL